MCRGLNQTPAGLVPLSLLLLLLAVGPRATGALLAVPPTCSPACRGGVWGTPPTLLSPDRANRSGGGVQCTTPQAGGGGGGGHAPQARQTILNALLAEVGRTHPDRERVRYLCCCLRTGGAEVKSVEGKFWEQVYPHASNHLNMWYIVGDGTGGSRGGGQHLAGGRVGHQAPHFYCSQIGRVLKKFKLTRSGGDDDDEEVGGGTGTRRGVQNFLFMFPARGVWYTLRMLRRRVRCALVRLWGAR